ncbi:MAG: hypothetical protein ACR2I0_01215 [Rhodoferax sp.]
MLIVQPSSEIHLLLVGLLCLVSGAAAWRGWSHSATGYLRWDGQQWHWSAWEGVVGARLVLHADLQRLMLVSLHGVGLSRIWLCLQQQGDAAHWRAVRRAVIAGRGRTDQGASAESADLVDA